MVCLFVCSLFLPSFLRHGVNVSYRERLLPAVLMFIIALEHCTSPYWLEGFAYEHLYIMSNFQMLSVCAFLPLPHVVLLFFDRLPCLMECSFPDYCTPFLSLDALEPFVAPSPFVSKQV